MTFVSNANMPIFRGQGAVKITSQTPNKQDKDTAGNIKRIRFLFWWCFISQIYSNYRAYEIYQDFYGWGSLNSHNKVSLAWGIVGTVLMALFIPGYMVLEYRRSTKGAKDQVA
ncbi:hypothetical protein F5Y03DRAFT_367176 [Xylaria venustula]|nr:hypothetical protein F5Y03DRAFT_367176 [Xylaria venustula]